MTSVDLQMGEVAVHDEASKQQNFELYDAVNVTASAIVFNSVRRYVSWQRLVAESGSCPTVR